GQLPYGLYCAASPGQNAMETQMGGKTHGVFTFSFVETVRQIQESQAWERLPMMVQSLVKQRMDRQDPLFFNPEMILSRDMTQDIFVDLVQYCEGEVTQIKPSRVRALLNFALAKELPLVAEHLLRLSQYSSSRKQEHLYQQFFQV
ncbi:MAG: hypothetical protein AAGM67_04225, partial [Bacteroidota bacterium]